MCSACGGGSTVTPSSAALDAVSTFTANGPGPTGGSKIYQYIVDDYGTYATYFHYPKSDEPIGKIENVGGQACTNVLNGYGNKFFWIVADYNQITEYAVPKKPIKTLSISSDDSPSSCALDSAGDLTVGVLDGAHSGDIVIFKNASGSGTYVSTPLAREYFEGYDNKGNLFLDGPSRQGYASQLDEMPKGTTKIRTIETTNKIGLPGSIQWDGKYLTLTDMDRASIYRYTVSGTKATLVHTISLLGAGECTQTWIAGDIVYCADAGNGDGEIFKYPAGGSPIATLKGPFDFPLGTVVVKE